MLRYFGYKIIRVGNKQLHIRENLFTMGKALERCRNRGLKINTVVDVGASNGIWSRECLKYFPKPNYLLVEAQEAHKPGLETLKKDYPNIDFVIAAAGETNGKIFFDNSGLFGGVASKLKFEGNCIEVPMISLDAEVKKRALKRPFLVKLDTHGFEVPILQGALELLKNAELVIIETYNYRLTNDSLKYYEMCSYMEELGFSSVEMVDFMLRKHDNTFWQMDTFYVPSNNKNFCYKWYE